MATVENSKANIDAYTITIRDLYFAMKTTKETTNSPAVYSDEIIRASIAKKLSVKGNGKVTDLWASGIKIASVNQETSEEISIDHTGLRTSVLDQLTGALAENGISFATSDAVEAPEFAMGFVAEKSNGVMDAMWFPNCTVDPATVVEYDTGEDEFKEQDPSMTVQASGLRDNHALYAKYSNQRETTLTVDDFMKQVVFNKDQAAALTSTPAATETPTEA